MPATEPEDLADIGWDGNTEETEITNDPENAGFPARKSDGELVFIVKHRHDGTTKVLIDADGNEWVDYAPTGFLVEYDKDATPLEVAPLKAGADPDAKAAEDDDAKEDEDDTQDAGDVWANDGGA